VPFFVPSEFVVTIHDLILTKFKTIRATTLSPWLYHLKNFFYRIIIKRALKKSKKIITVSNFTKNDIIEQFKIPADKIEVTYEGVANLAKGSDSLFITKLDQSKVLNSYSIENSFLLYVGNAYPHKNLDFLLRAFKVLYQEDQSLRLVLVGQEDYFYRQIKDLDFELFPNNSPVIFTGYVPDNELEILYQQALLYAFPSLYEGFGLPPLEAMAKSCPVLSSQAASMPEILGSAAMYFDPRDQADFLKKSRELISNEVLRLELIERGREQVKKYSWWDCALATREIYLE
jgi:glycosyltransferase involved in cell wall biosynthesis